MPDNSSTGGYLLPLLEPAPLEGLDLNNFIQGWIAGITGLAGNLVRPRWQAEAPNVPATGTAWAAVGTTVRPADEFPHVVHDQNACDGQGADILYQHEDIDILVSFYDLGTNGQAEKLAAMLRQGLAIDQNLEPLTLNGMGLISCGQSIALPSLLKTRWNYRVDMTVSIKREIVRVYPVQNIESINITIEAENAAGQVLKTTIIEPRPENQDQLDFSNPDNSQYLPGI